MRRGEGRQGHLASIISRHTMRYLCFRLLEMKLCDEQIRISSTGSSVWVSHNNNNKQPSSQPSQERLVASYVTLYSQARLDTLDALDKLGELRQAEELKSKLLFSIIVVSSLPPSLPHS